MSAEYVDLSQFFPQGPGDPEQARAMAEYQERLAKAIWEMETAQFARTQFFGAMICRCSPYLDREDPNPPQVSCALHGRVWMDGDGSVMLFGIPRRW